jgi:2-methylcitrate dehydratase PrpD
MPDLTSAQQIAAFASEFRLIDVPGPVVERAKLHILDAIGLAFASTRQDYGQATMQGMGAVAGPGDCSVIGMDGRLPVRDAALVNAVLIHGLDFDDTHLASIVHPTCTSLPVALSLGEHLGISGADLLAGFLLGAETSIRIGLAADGGFHHVGYHATGVVSHLAATVTAARLLHLDPEQITAAQGIAASTAAGIQVFLEEGAWTKRFHPGWGAAAGITAAFLARSGFKGPTRPYEGKFGLFETHLQEPATMAALTDNLGETWHFGETALKPYPVCHFIHGAADAAIALRGEIGEAQIVAVKAFLPQPTLHIVAEPAEAKQRAATEYEAKFSAQFVVAACLLNGRFGLADLLPQALADAEVQALAKMVECHPDPDTAFPVYFSGGVEVTLADGRVLRRHVRINSGAGEKAMDEAAVSAKFLDSAGLAISRERSDAIRGAVLNLESVPASQLAALLGGS